ncbi:MAG: class I SAM-dependent methyltransferase [Euryarchaeota archaeon]|nr:class I SAM-dependent methyltransferase [Euryarchaeota archaeon]
MGVKRAYDEAIGSGYYKRRSGLLGKYDNVRTFWEDEIVRIFIRPYVEKLEDKGRIKVLDLGCGYGDGYELLAKLSDKMEYKGFDIDENFIEEARRIYKDKRNMSFEVANFSRELPVKDDYDFYFTSYGALSHNDDERNIRLLGDIADCSDDCFVLCDWLGAYSYEWQSLWGGEWIDYRISYLPGSGGESFPLRLITRENILKIVREASSRIKIEKIFDRSVFVGRHMDTSGYNEHCKLIRSAVNSLFEPNVRTNFWDLLINYHPRDGFSELNDFFEDFSTHWNSLVAFMMNLYGEEDCTVEIQIPEMEKLKKMVESDVWIENSKYRENVIEPQLGYALRNMEMRMQRGMGAAHGLIAILRVE